MAKKIRDVVVKVGEYQDRNTGETKARWKNVGALMQNEEDKSLFLMLERTFNPAGVPNPDGRESVLLSCFVPQERQESGGQQEPARQQPPAQQPAPQGSGAGSGGDPYNGGDDIPFSPEWRV